ncbi:MAG: DUF885 family protein, partial [Myxococcales bacterium]|nr:DUF885 family protein [Myxococcales bacterium]
AAADRLAGGPPPGDERVLLHGDCHPKNSLFDQGCIALIDLDQAGVGSPAADIASLLARLEHGRLLGETDGATAAALGEAFLAGYYAHNPTAATSDGYHGDLDGRWPDLSPAGDAAARAFLDDFSAKLQAIDGAGLDPEARLDLELIANQIARERFSLDVERPLERDPFVYSSILGAGLDDLTSREFASIDARGRHVASRLQALPAFVDAALARLTPRAEVRAPHARVAIAQLDGVRVLVRDELAVRTAGASAEVRAAIAAATPAAVAAIDRMQATLRDEVLPVAAGPWRLGPERFDEKLRLTLHTDMSAREVYELAVAEHATVRARMGEVARALFPILFGPSALQEFLANARGDAEALDLMISQKVLAALAADHPSADGLRDACEENLARLERFVADERLVPLDPKELLEVIWTPAHARGYAIAGLASPGPLEDTRAGLPSFYLVQPVPKDWPEKQRESFLREYNAFMLEILSIHEAIPGHFVQLYHAKREPSKVRRVFGNGAFVEGWAVYTERLMVEAGYAGVGPAPGAKRPKHVSAGLWRVMSDPAARAQAIELHGLKFYLRTVTNAILDHEIQAGDMTEEAAVQLMVGRALQEEGEARAKWVRAQLISAQLSTYFVGATAWFRLRAQAEARAQRGGAPLDLHEFHRAALAHGAPPVHWLPALMGWEGAAQARVSLADEPRIDAGRLVASAGARSISRE